VYSSSPFFFPDSLIASGDRAIQPLAALPKSAEELDRHRSTSK